MENKLTLINQNNLTLTGIKKANVISETGISAELENCAVQISGSAMEVKKLDVESGVLEIDGKINLIKFVSAKEKLGLLKRIFK